MTEKEIKLNKINPLEFYGANNVNINTIVKLFPKIKLIARDDVMKVIGEQDDIIEFEDKLSYLFLHFEKFGKITKADILQLIQNPDQETIDSLNVKDDVLVHGRYGKVIGAKTVNQRKLVKSCDKNDLVFAIGPAGTGKTYTAVALAVRALKNKEVKRIILTRPAVEAGENLGFLPGDLKEKMDPYMQPLYDALRDMISPQKLLSYFEDHTIEIAPLAFMRGRTLDNAFVILDEAQNATNNQLKMFLTRMGKSAKFVVTGDITQIDLPKNQSSGLLQIEKRLKSINGIGIVFLDSRDILRHSLVSKIIKAYDKEL